MPADDHLLAGLTDEQRDAVTTDAAPLLVLAGAGSGKTRVLTRRIAWQAAAERMDPRRVLAVTFTRKASSELVRRLRDLGIHDQVTAGTFHALALAQLRRRWLDQGKRPPHVLDRKTRLISRLIPKGQTKSAGALVVAVAREIEWAQARDLSPERYEEATRAARRAPPLPPSEMAGLLGAYGDEKRKRGVVDFDDLLRLWSEEIEGDPELAGAVRWRFRHVFVDEFQDLSPAQFRLLRAWLGDRRDLFAVGDDDQAIYGFGGADARFLGEFRAHFGDDAVVLRLTSNFRSTPQILAVANAIIAPTPDDARRLHATSDDGPTPTITSYENDAEEAAGIGRVIEDLRRDGTAYRSIAVLARTNAQCVALGEALSALRIPARVRGASRFLERADVERALADLDRNAANDETPATGPFAAGVSRAVAAAPRTAPDSEAALSLLVELADEYAAHEPEAPTIAGFRDFVAIQIRDEDPTPSIDAVEILTFHRAKGLEWPVVFVTGIEDGFVPISHASTPAARDEERRLLHVALTRAERRLFMSWARARSFGGRPVARAASPFIAGLSAHLPSEFEPASAPATDAGLAALREVGLALQEARAAGAGGDSPNGLYAALTDWRERRARVAGVPEGAIVDDATLLAIAKLGPTDESALAELPGLGASRLARYGPEIIDLITDYARQ